VQPQARPLRAALEAGTDPEIVSQWIAQVQAERSLAEARQRQRGARRGRLGRQQIQYVVTTLTNLTRVIRTPTPRDKTEIYSQLGLRLTYHPEEHRCWSKPDQHRCRCA